MSCDKSTSPYAKKLSQSKKNERKITHESLSNLVGVNPSIQSHSNLKGLILHDLARLSSKKKLSKNKSPSFTSLKKETASQNNFKSHIYVPTRFYNNLKTELPETQNSSSLSSNKLIKKKKLVT